MNTFNLDDSRWRTLTMGVSGISRVEDATSDPPYGEFFKIITNLGWRTYPVFTSPLCIMDGEVSEKHILKLFHELLMAMPAREKECNIRLSLNELIFLVFGDNFNRTRQRKTLGDAVYDLEQAAVWDPEKGLYVPLRVSTVPDAPKRSDEFVFECKVPSRKGALIDRDALRRFHHQGPPRHRLACVNFYVSLCAMWNGCGTQGGKMVTDPEQIPCTES